MPDIFDRIAPDAEDTFDRIDTEETSIDRIKSEISNLLTTFDDKNRRSENRKITAEMKSLIQSEIAKIKPVQNIIEKTIEKQVVKNIHIPVELKPQPVVKEKPQIIREVRIEVQKESKKDDKKYAEEMTVEELKKEIANLKKALKETQDTLPFMMGGSGVIGLPTPEGNGGKTLQVVNGQWKPVAVASGGGTSSDVYTPSNVTTLRTYNATLTSLDEIANVLGSLIASLQGAGIIQ